VACMCDFSHNTGDVCSNRKLHEIAAFLNLVSPPTDNVDNVHSSEFLLELLVSLFHVFHSVAIFLFFFCIVNDVLLFSVYRLS